jgi:hypothetical protein
MITALSISAVESRVAGYVDDVCKKDKVRCQLVVVVMGKDERSGEGGWASARLVVPSASWSTFSSPSIRPLIQIYPSSSLGAPSPSIPQGRGGEGR